MKVIKILAIGFVLTLCACAPQMKSDTKAQSFQIADANHDGNLSFGEYQNYLDNEAGLGNADVQRIDTYDQPYRPKAILLQFQKLDLNRDTFVSRNELGMAP